MAEQSSSSQRSNLFLAGMNSDLDPSFIQDGQWSFARNASKVTASGSLQTLSTESSNKLCTILPYQPIGTIHLYEDKWAICSTDNTHSEIGIFDDSDCSYSPIKNEFGDVMDPTNCLNFNTKYLIKGISKQNFDCTWQIYFADGNNPDRSVNINKPQFVQIPATPLPCITTIDTTQIDCQATRLASLVSSPCVRVSKSRTGGTVLNGSYFAVIAYTINDQVVTDYFPPSNVQPTFEHSNLAGSLDITFTGLDTTHFSEFQLVLVRTTNQQVSAKKIGIYSTFTQEIHINNINESLPTVPIEQIPIRNPVFEKSDAIYSVGDYAIRVAPVTKFDFNYQPLANRIKAKWQSIQYPSSYYYDGGNNAGYMRDEIYPFFIRWIYTTGDRTASYHIPGRLPVDYTIPGTATLLFETDPYGGNPDAINTSERVFEVINTATVDAPFTPFTLPDGGTVISQGNMGYWQSTEKYPDNRPDIWNSSFYPWSSLPGGVDLCGLPIRHHKMPDNTTDNTGIGIGTTNHIDQGADNIRIIGVAFENIRPPVDNDGVPIPGIEGYEILRGSREGNKTVIAKGLVNNMRAYNLVGDPLGTNKGLYQNYPYNYLGTDPTLEDAEQTGGYVFDIGSETGNLNSAYKNNILSFHSPDTQFRNPFLGMNELKTYGQLYGKTDGKFDEVPGHPKEKLLGELAFFVAALIGVAEAILAIRGNRVVNKTSPKTNVISLFQNQTTVPVMTAQVYGSLQNSYDINQIEAPSGDLDGSDAKTLVNAIITAANIFNSQGSGAGNVGGLVTTGNDGSEASVNTVFQNGGTTNAVDAGTTTFQITESPFSRSTGIAGILGGIITAGTYFALGTDTALRLIESIVPYRQYAMRYLSHGTYDHVIQGTSTTGNRRFNIYESSYLDNNRQSFAGHEINNLYRGRAVVLNTKPVPDPSTIVAPADDSLTTLGQLGYLSTPNLPVSTNINSHYGALIQRFSNQYGQLDSIQQLGIGCPHKITSSTIDYTSDTLFGGDTYVTRYTEKNTFFYFYDWLMDQPDGYEFDYRSRYMITYPRFWADFTRQEIGDVIGGQITAMLSGILSFSFINSSALDGNSGSVINNFIGFLTNMIRFRVKDAYFYLFQSGVRDFYVESEVNTALRDWGESPDERFYDPKRYNSTYLLFDPKIIKAGNYFKYDYSLSVSRLFTNFISWGNIQPRYYDPLVAETCYIRRPNRLIYSLPQNTENIKDYWRVYLANNYKDFDAEVSVIKSTAKNGAIILFKTDSPLLFQGVDVLKTELGTKVTLGDGGLFTQAQQSIVNVDVSYEYGSCQDRLSVINTPFGLFYICTNQGKIFQATDTLKDITYDGLKFWFKEYLPFRLLKDFPEFDILDNPVAGIGCQAIYDNQIETIYFSKRDFQLRDNLSGPVVYSGNGMFSYNSLNYSLGDPALFHDASFTVSYDPKSEKGGWISYHDWHPDLNIPSKNNFLTIKSTGIWRHNDDTQSYCNYYGVQYPFAVEYIYPTLNINTLRSIEYYLECYKYNQNTLDRFNLLDYNFDHAIIHNLDQVSGVLNLVLTPKNDPWGELLYPKLNLVPEYEILYSKEESKYRFNQFWDITRSRGEFPPFAKQAIWITEPNGYIRTLNPNNLNYTKEQTERKKFRGYLGKCLLYKKNPGNVLMSIKAVQTKLLESIR